MAKQKNIKQHNKRRPDVRWKDYLYFLALGAALFYLSAALDGHVKLIFENIKIPAIDFVFGLLTNFGIVLILFLVLPSIILYKKDKKAVYFIALAFVSAFVLSFIIKLIVLRQRPIEAFAYPLTNIINYSFPSMHSMVVFALLPFLAGFFPWHKRYWIGLAVLAAFTRIYFSFHYLSDVVFGIMAGHLIGGLLFNAYKGGYLWKN